MTLLAFIQQVSLLIPLQDPAVEDIKKKISDAPDSAYQIGVIIGTYLPMLLLVAIAYYLYFKARKRKK